MFDLVRSRFALSKPSRWRRVVVAAALALLAVAAALLVAIRLLWPQAATARAWIAAQAQAALGGTVTISTLETHWDGWQPAFVATGITVADLHGKTVIHVDRADGAVSWLSLPALELRFAQLRLVQPVVRADRDAAGHWWVAGMQVDAPADLAMQDWVFSQPQLQIERGRLQWFDAPPKPAAAPTAEISVPALTLTADGRAHRLLGAVFWSGALTAPATFDIAFSHGWLGHAGRFDDWNGQMQWRLPAADLAAVGRAFGIAAQGHLEGDGRVAFDQGLVAESQSRIAVTELVWPMHDGRPPLRLALAQATVRFDETRQRHQLIDRRAIRRLWLDDAQWSLAPPTAKTPVRTLGDLMLGWQQAVGKPQILRYDWQAERLDLDGLRPLLAALPLPSAWRAQLDALQPGGVLTGVAGYWEPPVLAHGSATKGEPARYRFAATFAQAGWRPATLKFGAQELSLPGFEGFDGTLDVSDSFGTATLRSLRSLTLPGWFETPRIALTHAAGALHWVRRNDRVAFDTERFEFANDDVAGHLGGTLTLPQRITTDDAGQAQLQGRLDRVNVGRIGVYVPTVVNADTRRYLKHALTAGMAHDVSVAVDGPLAQFPFARGGGTFKVDIPIVGVTFNPARDPLHEPWPSFTNIDGRVAFERGALQLDLPHAQLRNAGGVVALSNLKGGIADFKVPAHAGGPVLQIAGDAAGPTQAFVDWLNHSPVGGWIGNLASEASANGHGKLALQLEMPLDQPAATRVTGRYRFDGGDVTLMQSLPPLSAVNGEVQFTEAGFKLNGLRARFLGGDIAPVGGTLPDGSTQVTLRGVASAEGLRSAYLQSALSRFLRQTSGALAYQATVRVRNGRAEVTVDSDLTGLALALPSPLDKPAAQPVATHFVWRQLGGDGGPLEELAIQYGNLAQAGFVQRRRGGAAEVLRGGIGIRQPQPRPTQGVAARIALDVLDLDAWRAALGDITGRDAAVPAPGPAAQPTFGYLPTQLQLNVRQLRLFERTLDDVALLAHRHDSDWSAQITSPRLDGHLYWRAQGSGVPFGQLRARLSRLDLPDRDDEAAVADILEHQSAQIPALDLQIDDFSLSGKRLGKVALNAHSSTAGKQPEWLLDRLQIEQPGATLQATGRWLTAARGKGVRQMNLDFALAIRDGGKLLEQMGLPQTLERGTGRLEGQLSWNGSPFHADLPSLQGKLAFALAQGQFLRVDPGAARLLGILSLQGIAPVALFDLRGLTASGTPFDRVSASGTIANGIAETDDFEFIGAQAQVLMRGTADLINETQNLNLVVLPNVNAGSASLAYTLINPAIGLGTLAAQLVLGDQFAWALRRNYTVTGSWADPTVTQIEQSSGDETGKPKSVLPARLLP